MVHRALVGLIVVVAGALSGGVGSPVSLTAVSDGRFALEWIFDCDDGGNCYGAIFVARSDGTGVRRVTPVDDLLDDPAWSPDVRRIAYSRSPYGIWVVNADGSGRRQLCDKTSVGACGDYPAWSPDGRRLAYIDDWDGSDLAVMDVARNAHRRLLTFAGEPAHVDWSPDGKQIAFAGYAPKPAYEGGWEGIWLVNADGRGLRRFVANMHYPRWSPDGKKLLAIGGNEGGYMDNIYVVDPRGKPTLVVKRRGVLSASWSPDGTRIAYSAIDPYDLRIVDLKTRRDTRVTLRPSPCAGRTGCSRYIPTVDWR